jgi:hypothetical protein
LQQGLNLLLLRNLCLCGLGLVILSGSYAALLYGAHRSKDPLVRRYCALGLRLLSAFYYTTILLIPLQWAVNLSMGKSLQDRSLLGHYLEEATLASERSMATLRRVNPQVEAALQSILLNLQPILVLRMSQSLGRLCQLTGDPLVLVALVFFHIYIRSRLDGWILGAGPLPGEKDLE